MIIGMLPANLANIYITKEQKKASKVASMMTAKELSDYKNFVDYENLNTKEIQK